MATVEVRAPVEGTRASCGLPLDQRVCADDYEPVGLVEVGPSEERSLVLSFDGSWSRCARLLWLRLVRLGGAGPINELGTLVRAPSEVELEVGAGAIHSVAFPQATVRIDEVGPRDLNQAPPPVPCAADR